MSQILDHLLGVFSFTCTRLSSVRREEREERREKREERQTMSGEEPQKQNKTGFNVVILELFF